jgi:hypothetical protein
VDSLAIRAEWLAALMHEYSWRLLMKGLSWINFILGLWLIVAGFMLGAGSTAAVTQNVVLGIIIAVFAAWAALSDAQPVASWIVALAGLWTLISPAVTHGLAHTAHTNNIIVGIVVLILGFANAVFRHPPARTAHA